MSERRTHGALSEPPEGVLSGESVPRENDEDDVKEAKIQRVVSLLKVNGYTYMSQKQLRRKSIDILNKAGDL